MQWAGRSSHVRQCRFPHSAVGAGGTGGDEPLLWVRGLSAGFAPRGRPVGTPPPPPGSFLRTRKQFEVERTHPAHAVRPRAAVLSSEAAWLCRAQAVKPP